MPSHIPAGETAQGFLQSCIQIPGNGSDVMHCIKRASASVHMNVCVYEDAACKEEGLSNRAWQRKIVELFQTSRRFKHS